MTRSIQAYKPFTLLLTDANGVPIDGASVYIKESNSELSSSISNEQGHVNLIAPNYEEITIISNKQGYTQATISLSVSTQSSGIDMILDNPNSPIAIAGLILITVIIYVTKKNQLRLQKESHFSENEINDNIQKPLQHPSISLPNVSLENHKTPIMQPLTQQNSKIEEIHLPPTHSITDNVSLHTPARKPKSTHSYRWFEQTVDVEKKIDSILEASSKRNIEEWFLGTEQIRKKIDETLKEKDT
jgi:hypothetical protein